MPEFDQLQKQLQEVRKNISDAKHAQFLLREKLDKIKREKDVLLRKFNQQNHNDVAALQKLEEQDERARAELNRQEMALEAFAKVEIRITREFDRFIDPREFITRCNDDTPFLLFPVRIETRFKKVANGRLLTDQLWIRIYPDDCAVDTFEKTLTEAEVSNAVFFWQKWWEAGTHEDQERAAWRTLVSSHGSGRASYIVDQYKPVNLNQRPTKANKEDVLLVITANELPGNTEQSALQQFYERIWLHSGNVQEEAAAWDLFVMQIGDATTAEMLVNTYKPFNLDVLPGGNKSKPEVTVKAVFLVLSQAEAVDTKLQSWTQAPRVNIMPDCFVVTGYRNGTPAFEVVGSRTIPYPLIVGPDPSVKPEEQFTKDENGNITVSEDMKWMVDFDAAIQAGLGFKIDITAQQATEGFDKIVVLGIRLSADDQQGKEMVQTLLTHHRQSRKGLSLLKQGAATNNTETEGADHQNLDDADESYDERKNGNLFQPQTNILEKQDGQWLAEALGIDYEILFPVKNAGNTDLIEGRMMNTALWPATMGFVMDSLMQPVFSDNDIIQTRNFFNKFVLGRGALPAIKIGKQPYGILPTAAFSQLKWPAQEQFLRKAGNSFEGNNPFFISRLYNILKEIDNDWNALINRPSYVGKPGGDPHQLLLDVLGLTPSSIEFYQRTAESAEDIFNRFNLMGFGGAIIALLLAGGYVQSGKDLLQKFGYTGTEVPEILNKFFLNSQNLLKGPVVDDRPLSEKDAIRAYTPAPGSANYITWLIDAARTSHDTLRKQDGFIDDKTPTALLYLLLHHALDLSYVEVSLLLHQHANLLTSTQVKQAKIEPAFLHISQQRNTSESKWGYLYKHEAVITGNQQMLVGDYIPSIIKTHVASEYLREQLDALEKLKDCSTARLERIFAEHLDCCSYRLDAWKAGMLNYQLSFMRRPQRTDNHNDDQPTYNKGLYIGAFGWLENVKSENKTLTPVSLQDKELIDNFITNETIPLVKDNTNGGHLLAPSLNHAVTASILRNGYIANNNPDALRINLSSERVRKALSVIEGMRGGQGLGALLGYYLERQLHDGYPGTELDFYIYQLRKAFPLVTNRNRDTKVDETSPQPIDSVEAIEARNVVDGLSLIEHITKTGNATYPFGKLFLPPVQQPAQATAINDAVQKIIDINDAVADVAIAESVHQVVQGNYDRGAATLDTYSKGNFPPIPDIIQTPRSGITITHRVGLHLETGLDPALESTARAQAEPALNHWLATVLPAPASVICFVSYGAVVAEEVNMNILGLQPIDLLYAIDTENDQSMKDLDDRIVRWVMEKPGVRPDTEVSVNYMKPAAGKFSIFELAPLIKSLHAMVLRSRPLVATDTVLPSNAKQEVSSALFLNADRIELRYSTLDPLVRTTLNDYLNIITPLTDDPVANRALIIAKCDQFMNDLADILYEAAWSGLPQSGYGFIYDRKKTLYAGLIGAIDKLIKRWNDKLNAFNQRMNEYNTLPGTATDEEKFELLHRARTEISTIVPATVPASPDTYKATLLLLKQDLIDKQDEFKLLFATTTPFINVLLTGIHTALPVDAFDLEPPSFTDPEDQVIHFVKELAGKAAALYKDLDSRLTKARAALDEAVVTIESKKKTDLVIEAGKLLFNDEFTIIPEYSISPEQAEEWNNTYAARTQLLKHQTTTEKVDFPVDNWLYGVARVREKMHHIENAILLTEAGTGNTLDFHPVQFPYKENDSWLALSYPADYAIDTDRLLYTAHYTVAFDKSKNQCGLLVDEWAEVIPASKETAGVAFHYDRPSSEPPQTLLLAMPAAFKGAWTWAELLGAVTETLDMAKKRAIEPAHVDTTPYARFLPALLSSMVTHPITASLNLSINNQIHEVLINTNHE